MLGAVYLSMDAFGVGLLYTAVACSCDPERLLAALLLFYSTLATENERDLLWFQSMRHLVYRGRYPAARRRRTRSSATTAACTCRWRWRRARRRRWARRCRTRRRGRPSTECWTTDAYDDDDDDDGDDDDDDESHHHPLQTSSRVHLTV
jgi:hypothetical protein